MTCFDFSLKQKQAFSCHKTRNLFSFKMVNGLHLYNAFTDPMATKALYILPHIHPFTHSYTNGGVSHAGRHRARRKELGFGVLLMDTSTLGQVESGIESPTF